MSLLRAGTGEQKKKRFLLRSCFPVRSQELQIRIGSKHLRKTVEQGDGHARL